MLATDADQFGTANSLFTMKIISVSPQTLNTEFFIEQTEGDVIGKIYFKGCLDYEVTYTQLCLKNVPIAHIIHHLTL